MKNRRDIKNELAYFRKVVRNMDLKDFSKKTKIDDHEILFSELDFSSVVSSEINFYQRENLCDWIDDIQNEALHKALQNLSEEEKILLSYMFYKDKTQTEIAKIYNVSQSKISKKINRVFKILKNNLLQK